MTIREKKDQILLKLYKRMKDEGLKGKPCGLSSILNIDRSESRRIGIDLKNEGLIFGQMAASGFVGGITIKGEEYVEEELLKTYEYHPQNLYTESEKSDIIEKLDLLLLRIQRLEMGHEIIYDNFEKEFNDLKAMLNFLDKKDWRQMLYGKLVDAGLGVVAAEVYSAISEIFKESKLIS